MTRLFSGLIRSVKRLLRLPGLLLLFLACIPPDLYAMRDVVLMLDNSGSMKANDPHFLGKNAARAFLERLPPDTEAGLLIFDQSVRMVVPLTPLTPENRQLLFDSLEQIDYRGLFTDSPAAMERAIYELKNKGRPGAERMIIFMTDGIVDTGDKERDIEKVRWLEDDLAADAAAAGIRVFGIAYTDKADFQVIQTLARKTGGAYFRAYAANALDDVFRRINEAVSEPPSELPPIPISPGASPVEPEGESTPFPDDISEPQGPADSTTAGDYSPLDIDVPGLPPGLRSNLDSDQPGEVVVPLFPTENPKTPEAVEAPMAEATQPATGSASSAQVTDGGIRLIVLVGAGAAVISLIIGGLLLVKLHRAGRGKAEDSTHSIPKAYLNDLNEVSGRATYELLDRPLLVGRALPSEEDGMMHVVVDESTIGRRHAIIEYKDYTYWLVDLNSVNGTYLNGKKITEQVPLKHGDRIRFHKAEFEFVMPEMFETGMTLMSHTVFAGNGGQPAPEEEEIDDDFGEDDVTQPRAG